MPMFTLIDDDQNNFSFLNHNKNQILTNEPIDSKEIIEFE